MSKKTSVATLTLIAAVIASATWVTAAANSAAKAKSKQTAKPTAIAVVDIQRIFNGCEERQKIDADITQASEKLNDDIETAKQNLRMLGSDLELLKPGEPAYEKKAGEIMRLKVQLEVQNRFGKQQIALEQVIRYEDLYRKMREACGTVAQEAGYDLVLYRESNKLVYKNFAQLLNQMGARKVLWVAEDLDITDQVLQKMDNSFASQVQ